MPKVNKSINLIIDVLKEFEEGLTQSEISSITGLAQSTISEAVKILERRGVVKKEVRGNVKLVKLAIPALADHRVLKLGIIRACEYPFIAPLAKRLKRRSLKLDVAVYENGLTATLDLVLNKINFALTPFITQLLYYTLVENIAIVGGGAGGGAFILENPRGREAYGSTKASSMEFCISMYEPAKNLENVKYFKSGEEALKSILNNEVKYVALWEPYASKGVRAGLKLVANGLDLGLKYCCTLAMNLSLDDKLAKTVLEEYGKAFKDFEKDPNTWLSWYSIKTGISVEELKTSINSYIYNPVIDTTELKQLVKNSNLHIPSPSTINQAVKHLS